MILQTYSNGRLEDVDTASCLSRIHYYLIKKLIGKKTVMANVKFNFIDPNICPYNLISNSILIYNTTFPAVPNDRTVQISKQ